MAEEEARMKRAVEFDERIIRLYEKWGQKVDWLMTEKVPPEEYAIRWFNEYSKSFSNILAEASAEYKRGRIAYDDYYAIRYRIEATLDEMKSAVLDVISRYLDKVKAKRLAVP